MYSAANALKPVLWVYYCALLAILIFIPQWGDAYSNPFPFAYFVVGGSAVSPYDILIVVGGAAARVASRDIAIEKVMLKWGALLLVVLTFANAVTIYRTNEFLLQGLNEVKCAIHLWAITHIIVWIVNNQYLKRYFFIQVLFTIGNNVFQYFELASGSTESWGVNAVSLLSLSAMPFCVLTVSQSPRLFSGSCCGIAIVSTGCIALLGTSRGNIVMFLMSVLGPAIYVGTRRVAAKSSTFSRLAMTAGVAGSSMALIFALAGQTDIGRSFRFWESQQGIYHDATNASHYDDLLGGTAIILKYPFLGAGVNNLQYDDATDKQYVVIHNELLHVWVFYGLFGLVAFFSLLYVWPLYGIYTMERSWQGIPFYFLFFAVAYCLVRATIYPKFMVSVTGTYIVGTSLGFAFCRPKYSSAGLTANHRNPTELARE